MLGEVRWRSQRERLVALTLRARNGPKIADCYFLTAFDGDGAGLWPGAADDATWTIVPVVRESDGLTITLSDSETPLRISDWTPKSRPTLTSRSWTTPLASTTPTCTLLPRNMSVLSGRVTSFPQATSWHTDGCVAAGQDFVLRVFDLQLNEHGSGIRGDRSRTWRSLFRDMSLRFALQPER